MFRSFVSSFLAFAVCLCAGSAPAVGKKTQTIKGWGEVVDPDGDCTVKEAEGKITITVPKTHHDLTYTEQFTKLNAPRILQKAQGNFLIQVKVHAIPLPGKDTSSSNAHSFTSCGLLIWQDDRNFIRMDRAAEGNGGGEFVWVERFTNGRAEVQRFHPVENRAIHLRIARAGNKLTFSFTQDADAKEWTEVHTDDVNLPNDLQVGVLAINTTTSDFSPQLEGLQVRREN